MSFNSLSSNLSSSSGSNTNLLNCSNSPNPRLQLPSPIITKRTRTASTSARALENPVETGIVKSFSRSKGHGFLAPHSGGDDIFVHISDIEGEYVPLPGDEVKYRLCAIPPKYEKHQAIHVCIINLVPEKHTKWEEPCGDEGHHGHH